MSVTRISNFDFTQVDKNKKFILDTNILYFVHTGYYLGKQTRKKISYSNFIGSILSNGNTPIVPSSCLQGLAHIIENQEYKAYYKALSRKKQGSFNLKKFRAMPPQRNAIMGKIDVILKQLEAVYTFCDIEIRTSQLKSFVSTYTNHKYDPIDYITVESFLTENVFFVTDDKDFQADSRIDVVTL